MKLGFSGSQYGMTSPQRRAVYETFSRLKGEGIDEVHHGCCIGADAEVHNFARYDFGVRVVVHPPTDQSRLARVLTGDDVVFCEPKPYLERNQDIVDATDALIAAPHSAIESMRSGTWATIRRAKKKGIPIFAFGPDGKRLDV